jgi:NDP-sugar pyrophosphorylase family protein
MIVIPMAGLSSRFHKAGYDLPKYMLRAKGKTLFEHSVSSFKVYFKTEKFLFIIRNEKANSDFVNEEAIKLGILDFEIISLDADTRGQAETVALGLQKLAYNGPITIFNIDTFRPAFIFPKTQNFGAGYLEVFKGDGDNWSYVKPLADNSTVVVETAEKRPLSNLCCTGLYHFKSAHDFMRAFSIYLAKPSSEWEKGELYIAPLYNILINDGLEIHYHLIERSKVTFCGIPSEYIEFLGKL